MCVWSLSAKWCRSFFNSGCWWSSQLFSLFICTCYSRYASWIAQCHSWVGDNNNKGGRDRSSWSFYDRAIFASIFLKETLGPIGRVGCLLSVVGSLIVVLHAPEDKNVTSIDELLFYALQPGKKGEKNTKGLDEGTHSKPRLFILLRHGHSY